jgi:hypothetical protein
VFLATLKLLLLLLRGGGATLVKPFEEGLLGNQVAFIFQGKKARGGARNGQPNQSLAGHDLSG